LELVLWARAQHHPVTLHVGLGPLAARAPLYSAAQIAVASTYWCEYRVTLQTPQNDTSAVFFCFLEEEGLVWLDQVHLHPAGAGTMRDDVRTAFQSLQIPVLRFPGGSVTGGYHWQFGTGPAHLRPALPDPVFKWQVLYDFGTDEYLDLCTQQGILPQISLNIGTGTPQEAEEWAAYVADWYRKRHLALPPMYWQIGNEQWGAWELGNMSGELYAEALRAFVPGVRRAYPAARIVALGPEYGETLKAASRLPWRAPVLDKAGDLIDLVVMQWYGTGWDEDANVELLQALRAANALQATVQRAITDCRATGRPTRVGVTEWNYWRHASHYDDLGFLEPYDVLHGLFVAAVLHQFVRATPDLELANFYHLINPMGVFISRGPQVQETPLAPLFRLYRPAFPGQVIPLRVEGVDLADGLAAVDAVALTNDAGHWLLVANRHPSEAMIVNLVDWPAFAGGQVLIGEGLREGWRSASIASESGQVVVPPQSVARLLG
jgi:alpha-L-arabinofuranosidase